MKRIKLTQGKYAIVDDEDYEYLNQVSWRYVKSGHAYYGSNFMQDYLMKCPKDMTIDHINRNGLDNRKENLRLATKSQNAANKGLRSSNKTGYKGICFISKTGKWKATITCNGFTHFIGSFLSAEEAARAYDKKAYELFGKFAYLNFP